MANFKATKQIKLQPKHREQSGGQKIVPCLNVSGVWLEELGWSCYICMDSKLRSN